MAVESKLFNISSLTGIKLNDSKLSFIEYTIPNFIKNDDDNIKAVYLSVKNTELPNSFYLVNDYNNKLTLLMGVETEYILENGNYNVNTFVAALSNLLGANYNIAFNSKTQKILIFTNITNVYIVGSKTTMNRFLGIPETTTNISFTSNIINAFAFCLIPPYVVNFLPSQKIHFRSSSFQIDSYNAFDQSSDIFLSIQNNGTVNGAIQYINLTNLRNLIDIRELSTIKLRITDDRNREMDFNGVIWYLTFQVDYEYFQIPTKSNLRNFLKNNSFVENYINSLDSETFEKMKSNFQNLN